MKALLTWFLKLWQRPSANGPQPTSPNSSPSSTPKSTPAPTPNGNETTNRIATLAQIAEREIGKKEVRSNVGAEVRKYQRATNLDPGAWPWCAAFIAWCVDRWLDDPENVQWLGLKRTTPQAWRPKTALAYGLLKWAEARPNTCQVLPDTAMPQAGDIVVYDFSHCGIVLNNFGELSFVAIEGNTDAHGGREGDGVWKKLRTRHIARAFIRIRPSKA